MMFVNVYEKQQRFGGPEEGGWYYDAWEPVPHPDMRCDDYTGQFIGPMKYISQPALNQDHAERIAEHLSKEYTFDRKDYTSVCSRRSNYDVRIEDHPPQASSNYHPYE